MFPHEFRAVVPGRGLFGVPLVLPRRPALLLGENLPGAPEKAPETVPQLAAQIAGEIERERWTPCPARVYETGMPRGWKYVGRTAEREAWEVQSLYQTCTYCGQEVEEVARVNISMQPLAQEAQENSEH